MKITKTDLFIIVCIVLAIAGAFMIAKWSREIPEPGKAAPVNLYYYNARMDQTNGCDVNAVLPVARKISYSGDLIAETIRLLIQGDLQANEKSEGFATEFPNKDFRLLGARLDNGVLTLNFTEVPGFTSGGSCRVGLLANEIIKTAKQFPEVKEVRFEPVELFQP